MTSALLLLSVLGLSAWTESFFLTPSSSSSNEDTILARPWDSPECQSRPVFEPSDSLRTRRGVLALPYLNCPDIFSARFGCLGQSNEDCKIYKRFFSAPRWKGEGRGFYLEMGGFDGLSFSNTFIFEHCLGWHGLLIESHPTFYQEMIKNRPCALGVWGAVCNASLPNAHSHTYMVHDYIQATVNLSAVAEYNQNYPNAAPRRVRLVPCRRLSSVFSELNITHIDFMSLDVEGMEAEALASIDFARVTISVIIVEADFFGNRNASIQANHGNSTVKMARVHDILTNRAGMLLMPSDGISVPDCTRLRLRLPRRVFALHGSALYVAPSFRDDVCP